MSQDGAGATDPSGAAGPGSHRDRDVGGQPRSSRPRDALGRPLAYGSAGVPPLPDELDLTPEAALVEAQRLLDAGLPFQAHEVLESAWKTSPAWERPLWQGLAQIAVGLTHARRGNTTGAATVLRRGCDHIAGYATAPPYGIDIAGLTAWADQLLAELPGIDPDAPILAGPTLVCP